MSNPGAPKQLGQHVAMPNSPEEAQLERVPNPHPGTNYVARFTAPEFTSLCPVTGQPDTARIQIRYIPSETCIETKSLKFYLTSFRNHQSFNEEIVNRILSDIVSAVNPREAVVRGDFSPRGGISLTAQASHPQAQWNGLSIDEK